MLLGTCKVCPTLKEKLVQVQGDLEKWTTPSSICEDFLPFRMELATLKAEVKLLEKLPSHRSDVCNVCAA